MRRSSAPLVFLVLVGASACTPSSASDPSDGGDVGAGGNADDGPSAQGSADGSGGGSSTAKSSNAAAGGGDDASAASGSGGENASGSGGSGGAPADTCPRARVDVPDGDVLNVRPTPSTEGEPIGSVPDGALVDVLDQVTGEAVEGNDAWLQIERAGLVGFVSSVFATCTTEEPPEPPDGYLIPLVCDTTTTITQGNNGDVSHNGSSRYAFDFGVPLNTPVVAMADGEVVLIYDETGPGDPCYNGGGSECSAYSNLVSLRHGDGTATQYKHLESVAVSVGDVVARADVIGYSGTTGWSTGAHLHAVRTEDCGQIYCNSIPLAFGDVPGDGVPVTGQVVTSGNCVD
jgi:murein DD-endopeptidase MepM/ murein hydrolase activator NlpD